MNYSDYIRGVHSMCRICLGKSAKTIPLADVKQRIEAMGEENPANAVKIDLDSKYPQNICKPCFDSLDYFTDLKDIYEKSQKILHKYLRLNDETGLSKPRKSVSNIPATPFSFQKRNWRCRHCYMDFETETAFKKHAKCCKKALQLKCEYCGKMFLTYICKKYHVKLKHQHPPFKCTEFKCDMCDEVFKKPSMRSYHKLTRHNTGVKSFDCEVCGKSFLIRNSLMQHLETHNKEASLVVCPICGKSFHYRGGLFYHMKVHKNERNYNCTYCDRKFLNMTAQKRHIRTHTGERPYKCNICPKSFCSTGELKMHIMRHTGQKPYNCKFCGKPYVSTYNMKVHIATHQGNFPCQYCNKSLLNEEVLQAHMEVKHKVKVRRLKKEERIDVYDEGLENFDLVLESV